MRTRVSCIIALSSASFFGILPTHIGASVQVLEHREVREQVELLEHHADVAAHRVDRLHVVGELDAVDDEVARLMLLEPVDAADQRGLARARRAADDDALALGAR